MPGVGGRLELATSPEILGEYTRVALELQSKFPEVDPQPLLGLVMHPLASDPARAARRAGVRRS